MVDEEGLKKTIRILMSREIVDEICVDAGDSKCYTILFNIVAHGEGYEKLTELPEEVRKKIREKLEKLGAKS